MQKLWIAGMRSRRWSGPRRLVLQERKLRPIRTSVWMDAFSMPATFSSRTVWLAPWVTTRTRSTRSSSFCMGPASPALTTSFKSKRTSAFRPGGSVFTLPANQAKYPTFFVAPQAPVGSRDGWRGIPGQAVLKLITALETEFSSIDTQRLYITGLSMGGYGTWTLIEDNPKLFACAVPMSAGGDTAKAANIAALPLWDFHGTVDTSVPVQESRDMIAAIEAAGGHPKYTEYPNGGHAIWDQAYTEPALLPWMFGTNAATIGVDGGLTDATSAVDTGLGSTGSGGSGVGTGVDAASPGEAGSSGVGGRTAAFPPTILEPRSIQAATTCNPMAAPVAWPRRVGSRIRAMRVSLRSGLSMRRRRRVDRGSAVRP